MRTPRYTRYAAPQNLIAVNAVVDVARTSDNPVAAAKVCIRLPVEIPRAEIIPALTPRLILRPKIYIVSVPGVRFNRMPESKKAQKLLIPMDSIFSFSSNVVILAEQAIYFFYYADTF